MDQLIYFLSLIWQSYYHNFEPHKSPKFYNSLREYFMCFGFAKVKVYVV
ncbi:MAG: hypothetical protein ACJAUH_002289 [Saprospiraceae bacterium]|jgi:hypothetical protein